MIKTGNIRMNVSATENGIQPVIAAMTVLGTDAIFSVIKSEKLCELSEIICTNTDTINKVKIILKYFGALKESRVIIFFDLLFALSYLIIIDIVFL